MSVGVVACDPDRMDFGDPRGESLAAVRSAVVIDVSNRARLEMTGPDRQSFLHNFCTNNITALKPGQGCEAFLCNIKGRVIGHIFAWAGTGSLAIESVPGQQEFLKTHLERYHLLEDFSLTDLTETTGELLLTGPLSLERLRSSDLLDHALAFNEHRTVSMELPDGPVDVSIRRTDMAGPDSYLLVAARERIPALWQRLLAAGAVPAGRSTFEGLRIASGFPVIGVDLTEDNLAPEAGRTERCIVFNKGCYLGQEPIARIHAMGHVNRELRGLRLPPGLSVPPTGTAVLHPTDSAKEIGRITSSGWSAQYECAVALSLLRVPFQKPGTSVVVALPEGPVTATVFWS